MHNAMSVFIVSDSVGETAERVARAAASQFLEQEFIFRRIPYASNVESLEPVLTEAQHTRSLIVHTLVTHELRDFLNRSTRERGIPCVDVMGPIMNTMRQVSQREPELRAELKHLMNEDYYREIEAVEFAVKYDDGRDPRGVLRADVVLVGVSRTSKTPLSMYLAHRGYRVANVPLVPEVSPPEELFLVPKEQVIGLTVSEEQLRQIRAERLRLMGLEPNVSYANGERIREELDYGLRIMEQIGCPVLDVTQRAVEETAGRVLEIIGTR